MNNSNPNFSQTESPQAPNSSSNLVKSNLADLVQFNPPPLTGGLKTPTSTALEKLASEQGAAVDLDYFVGTVAKERISVRQVKLLAAAALGRNWREWIDTPSGSNSYTRQANGPYGCVVMWDGKAEGGTYRNDVLLRMPGKACQQAGRKNMLHILKVWEQRDGHFTRLDLAIDDYQRIISPEEWYSLVKAKQECITRAEKLELVTGFSLKDHKNRGRKYDGATGYLGSRQSPTYLRVYDKYLESKGEINAIRWELELKEETAQTVGVELAGNPRLFREIVMQRLVSFLDFRDPVSESNERTHLYRRNRTTWFAQLVGNIGKAGALVRQQLRDLDRYRGWARQGGVFPALVVELIYNLGDAERWAYMRREGLRQMKDRHWQMLFDNMPEHLPYLQKLHSEVYG